MIAVPDPAHLTLSLGTTHPASDNSNDQMKYVSGKVGYELASITTFPP